MLIKSISESKCRGKIRISSQTWEDNMEDKKRKIHSKILEIQRRNLFDKKNFFSKKILSYKLPHIKVKLVCPKMLRNQNRGISIFLKAFMLLLIKICYILADNHLYRYMTFFGKRFWKYFLPQVINLCHYDLYPDVLSTEFYLNLKNVGRTPEYKSKSWRFDLWPSHWTFQSNISWYIFSN